MPEDKPLISIVWFRRDLRLEDNSALDAALETGLPVLTVFMFDVNIIEELPVNDPRITFIYDNLTNIHQKLRKSGSSLLVRKGDPVKILDELTSKYNIDSVYINRDYEPYAIKRDQKAESLLRKKGIALKYFKDQVIHEGEEVLKDDGKPYTVYTPYKNKWLKNFYKIKIQLPSYFGQGKFLQTSFPFPSLKELGFSRSAIKVREYDFSALDQYPNNRDIPSKDATSHLGPHLRFGTISIRQVISHLSPGDEMFLSELIWREFFMQILYYFPHVEHSNFRSKYDGIKWRNNETEFKKWCKGQTGYPIVDAGMRQLNETGYMHNRVRMITAGFLCKHLLTDWRWGEAYFAGKLLDYELSSNNGNWQWAAGTGCDAAPYFRVFNPHQQVKKFDKNLEYVRKWVPEAGKPDYQPPIIEHTLARRRALETYSKGINKQ